ncbi:hypothetical protein KIN20_018880 [Parelaphostrongylus tenuis]|uniref:Uncharacterized protein n=1 Tax=Parelaphostrongylus tenuis TaxID=148309 RepID=A0AAD5N4S3_PARTN|nr:hypothetical protein KIN20_018880 [Parelaphostrongylus tenuis]
MMQKNWCTHSALQDNRRLTLVQYVGLAVAASAQNVVIPHLPQDMLAREIVRNGNVLAYY